MTTPLEVKVRHWVHLTGAPEPVTPSVVYPAGYRETPPAGWFCWAYPNDDALFIEWMTRVCPGAKVDHRFNSGDPMFTVYIASAREAAAFRCAWVKI